MLKSQSQELEMDRPHSEDVVRHLKLPVSTETFVPEFLHVFLQDLSPSVVPVGLAATFVSVLSAIFVAYKWGRTKKEHTDETVNTTGGGESEKNQLHESKRETKALIKKNKDLEEKLTELRNKSKQQETQSKLKQKEEELRKTTEKLMAMNEESNKQQRLLHESKNETKTLIKKNQELEKKLTELRNESKQQETESKLKQKEEELRKTTEKLMAMTEESNKQQRLLHESKSETETLIKKNQKLEEKLTELRNESKQQETESKLKQKEEELRKTTEKLMAMNEESNKQQRLLHESKSETGTLIKKNQELEEKLTELRNESKQQPSGGSLAIEELKETQFKMERKISKIRDLQKELQYAKLHSESLQDKNQQLKTQLAELKERYKQENKDQPGPPDQ